MKRHLLLLLLLCLPANAATKLMTGFELQTGSLNQYEFGGGSATQTIDTSIKNSGCCSVSMAAGTNYAFLLPTGLNASTLYTRYYTRVHVTTNPASGTVVLNGMTHYNGSADVSYVRIAITSAGAVSLQLFNAITTTQIGSSFTISQDTWYLIEERVKTSPTANTGVLELKVNGTVVATGSSLDTGAPNLTDIVNTTYQGTLNGLAATVWIDDVISSDSAYPGPGKIIARQATTGTPTYNDWSAAGGSFPAVWQDNIASAGASQSAYMVAPTTGDPLTQTAFIASFSATQAGHGTETIASGDTINAAQGLIVTNHTAGKTYAIRRRVGGVNTDTSIAATTGYMVFREVPWTSTLTNINSMELGETKSVVAGSPQVTDIYVQVDYTVSTGPTGTPISYYRMMSTP